MTALPLGKAKVRRRGRDVAILAFGTMVAPAAVVAEKLDASLLNMRFIKPLDEAVIVEMANAHDVLVTVEENVTAGGAGSAINEVLAAHGIPKLVLNLGLPDRLLQHGSREDMLADGGLDVAHIEASIAAFLDKVRGGESAAQTA